MTLTRKESAEVMQKLVYPRMREALGVASAEAVADNESIADLLDVECKIDALVRLDGRITTVASRIHPVKASDKPYNTFTLGLGDGPASTTAQYQTLLRTTRAFGALHPYYVIEAYVSEVLDALLSFAVIGTHLLVDHVEKYLTVEDGRWDTSDLKMLWVSRDKKFCSVAWTVLQDPKLRLAMWPKKKDA